MVLQGIARDGRERLLKALMVLGVGLAFWLFPLSPDMPPAGGRLTAIFFATMLGLILQPLPQGALVITALALTALSGILPLADVLRGFSDPTVWLIVSAYLSTRGFIKTGLGRRIAFLMVRRFGRKTLGLGYAITLSDAILAPATPSNTARAGGILFPVLRSLCTCLGSEPGPTARRVGAFLMFNEFQTNLVTSALFLTAVAPNSLISKLARENFQYDVTWIAWCQAALLPGAASLVILPALIYRLFNPDLKHSPDAPEMARRELEKMGPMTAAEWKMLAVFVCTLSLWATGQWTGLSATAVGLAGVGALLVLRVIDWGDVLAEKGGWDALIWFGGLVSLAAGLSKLGVIDLLASTLKSLLGEAGSWELGFVLLVLAYVYAHYFIASMTAHATALFVPMGLVAVNIGAPIPLVVLTLGFMNSLNAGTTTYGTGPSPVYFGAGYIEQAAWWKNGLIISLVNILIWLTVGGAWWKYLGLW